MIYYLALRDTTAQYKQSVLGPLWIIINPVGYTIIFTFIFGVVVQVQTADIPYPIFNFAAMIPWTLFVGILGATTNAIARQTMIKKVYFPRLILPLVEVAIQLFNFLLTFSVLILMLLYYQITPTANIIWLPGLTLIAVSVALGMGLFFAPLQVRSRDVAQFVAYLSRFLLYATPALYPRELFPQPFDQLALINPMTTVIEGFRWAILGSEPPPVEGVIWAIFLSVVLLWVGALFFRRAEQSFADIA